jgi:cytochrome d ubiquinol oxidase subunit II
MVDLWYFLVCATFAAYVVLDGYDLGAGIVSPLVAKNDAERRAVLHTILPFWDGNEVFLVAGGATLYLAFPRLFPAFVSGFYLPVMIVLWLLMLRGLGIEMKHKLDHPLWNELWDGAFFVSSLLLVFFFGAALGNVVRGVSVGESGEFFAPLWTTFGVGEQVGILDWYTVTVALTAVVLVARHGALRLAAREEQVVGERAGHVASRLLVPAVVLPLVATAATFLVQGNAMANLRVRPWISVFGVLAAAGTVVSALPSDRADKANKERAFRGSCAALAGLFGCACVGVYPFGLLARVPERSVLAEDAAAGPHGLSAGLAWWLPGMALVVVYSAYAHRRLLRPRNAPPVVGSGPEDGSRAEGE